MNRAYNAVKTEKLLLARSGVISQTVIEEAAKLLRDSLVEVHAEPHAASAIYSVFIELAQNICRYSARRENDAGCGDIRVSLRGGQCILESRNEIADDAESELKARLCKTFGSGRDELRELFSQAMRGGGESSSHGAGIGLIQIAQITATPPEYRFRTADGKTELSLKATVSTGETEVTDMFKLEKERTVSTPYIMIDEQKGYMVFSGESFPENVVKFYSDVTDWIYGYLKSDFSSFIFDCRLVYFNSSTTKLLLDIFSAMDDAAAEGKRVIVNWTCNTYNEIIIECAEAFAEDFKNMKFRIILDENMQ